MSILVEISYFISYSVRYSLTGALYGVTNTNVVPCFLFDLPATETK